MQSNIYKSIFDIKEQLIKIAQLDAFSFEIKAPPIDTTIAIFFNAGNFVEFTISKGKRLDEDIFAVLDYSFYLKWIIHVLVDCEVDVECTEIYTCQ